MQDTPANQYLRTKVLTASPAELRMMLLEAAVKHARQGRDGLAEKNYEQSHAGFSRCRDIIMELLSGIRPDADAELAARVQSLYTFLFTHLTEGSMEKDLGKIDKVIELLEYERETWALVIDKLVGENPGESSPQAPSHFSPRPHEPAPHAASSISIQG